MIIAMLILGVAFWILSSLIKYLYYNNMDINYMHKLDPKILNEIRGPSKKVLELIEGRKHYREPQYKEKYEQEIAFDSTLKENSPEARNILGMSTVRNNKQNRRPLSLCEEMDVLQKKGIRLKRKPSKHTRDVFNDPLYRHYRDIEELKRESA